MSSRALLMVGLLVAAALAGCASSPKTSEAYTLTRQIRVHLDDGNIDQAHQNDVYKFVSSSFVVHVGASPVAASALTLAYTDRDGNGVSKPLSKFTTTADLAPGAEVTVDDANITSDATLSLNGVAVASRARAVQPWWNVDGYPIGVRLDPGAALSYAYTGSASEGYHLKDVTTTTDPAYKVDDLLASFGFKATGTLDLVYDAATSTVQAAKSHEARPLKWTSAGSMSFPVKLTAAGHNVSSGQAIDAGFELLDGSGASFDSNGNVWWNATGSPVRADVDGGSYHTNVDAIAWATGVPGVDKEQFSCIGKTRADGCRPTEMKLNDLNKTGPIDPSKVNLDDTPWNVDPAILANVTRFLSEDLVPGDELRFDVNLDSTHIPNANQAPDAPKFTLVMSAVLRAVDVERATVAAGAFDALKVVERADLKLTMAETKQGDKVVVGAFTIDQRIADTTFYLAKDTFVPLRFEQTTPLDLNAIADKIVASVPADAWTSVQVKPLKPENLDVTLEAKTSMELKKLTGGAAFSPWAVIFGFHSVGLAPAALAQSTLGGLGSGFGSTQSVPVYPTSPPNHKMPASLSIASAAPVTNDSKDYVVRNVSPGVSYSDLAFALDGDQLQENDMAPGWCVVVKGACEQGASYGMPVNKGDVIRLFQPDIKGKALIVSDSSSGNVILKLVVA